MKITIVGGGFGGVKSALELAKDKNNEIELITDQDHFQYYPALFSTATGYRHLQSWIPLGAIFTKYNNIRVIIDSIESIDVKSKTLVGKSKKVYSYEEIIIAIGMVTTYFGIKGLDLYAYGIKSAAEIKRLKLGIFNDIAERGRLDKHYVIVGAGPTGVELAAALGDYLKRLCKRYQVTDNNLHIDLIEASPRVLPRMSERASHLVERELTRLGVHVQTGKMVEAASSRDLIISGKSVESRTVIWTSGVANNPFFKNNSEAFKLAKNGKVEVDDYLQTSHGIYVIGDNANTPYSGLAQTALHDAVFVSKNLTLKNDRKKPFKYKATMPPVVVPVGHKWAIFEWRGITLGGRLVAWMRRVADFIGYTDLLPIGYAIDAWRSSYELEDDYFDTSKNTK